MTINSFVIITAFNTIYHYYVTIVMLSFVLFNYSLIVFVYVNQEPNSNYFGMNKKIVNLELSPLQCS